METSKNSHFVIGLSANLKQVHVSTSHLPQKNKSYFTIAIMLLANSYIHHNIFLCFLYIFHITPLDSHYTNSFTVYLCITETAILQQHQVITSHTRCYGLPRDF